MKHTCKHFEFGKEGRFCVLPVNTVLLDELVITLSLPLPVMISLIWSTNSHFHEQTFLFISSAIHKALSRNYLLLSTLHLERFHPVVVDVISEALQNQLHQTAFCWSVIHN